MPVGAVIALVDLHAVAAESTAAALVVSRVMRTTPMLAPTDREFAPQRNR